MHLGGIDFVEDRFEESVELRKESSRGRLWKFEDFLCIFFYLDVSSDKIPLIEYFGLDQINVSGGPMSYLRSNATISRLTTGASFRGHE